MRADEHYVRDDDEHHHDRDDDQHRGHGRSRSSLIADLLGGGE
jgi:hypothetical protein